MLEQVMRDLEDRTLPEWVIIPLVVVTGGGLGVVAGCFLMTAFDGVEVSLRGIAGEGGNVVAPGGEE